MTCVSLTHVTIQSTGGVCRVFLSVGVCVCVCFSGADGERAVLLLGLPVCGLVGSFFVFCVFSLLCVGAFGGEEHDEVLLREADALLAAVGVLPKGARRERALFRLELEDLVLDGVLDGEARDVHLAALADAVAAVDRLLFHGWVPPHVEEEDVVGADEVDAEARRLERHEHHRDARVLLELHERLVARGERHGAVEPPELEPLLLERALEEVEHGRPLRKDD
mmetsp:Transcript_2208/g.8016  ORF Transcript_2208/g.8016 Transcript_2208/m.8016 type:complete len:223 (-) Transcript_2208:554-1222(-)